MPGSNLYGGSLPFMSQYASGVPQLYQRTLASRLPQQDINAARDLMRAELATRGLNGPLAAGMTAAAPNALLADFARRRDDQLMRLMEMMRQAQMDEARRREMAWRARQEGLQGARDTGSAWGRGIGTGLGLLTAAIPGIGPIVAPIAAPFWGTLGGMAGGWIGEQTYKP